MSQALANIPYDLRDVIGNIVTEDDEPVDNIFSEKQQRLLTETLYSSWEGPGDGRKFFAAANIGVFYMVKAVSSLFFSPFG